MASQPNITFRAATSPYAVLSQLNYAQSALGGNNLPVAGGENSNVVAFRVYNNYAMAVGVATMFNVSVTVFDGASAASHTFVQSVAAQSWVRIYETGFGENSVPAGLYTQYTGQDTAIGRSLSDQYFPEYGSDGVYTFPNTVNPKIRAGTDGNGVGFIEFASYVEAPDIIGFASYTFAVSIVYEWTS